MHVKYQSFEFEMQLESIMEMSAKLIVCFSSPSEFNVLVLVYVRIIFEIKIIIFKNEFFSDFAEWIWLKIKKH